jgi:hypothetical protein
LNRFSNKLSFRQPTHVYKAEIGEAILGAYSLNPTLLGIA